MRVIEPKTATLCTAAAAVTAAVTVLLSACTAHSTAPDGASRPPGIPTTPAPPTTSSAASPTSPPAQSPPPTSRPASPSGTPTVPRDVPTIGHNTNPGEKPPVEPVTALAHTSAGARAFAVFFIKTIDWGYATTSSTYMRHYFDRSCIQCRNVVTLLNDAMRQGGHYVGSRITNIRMRSLSKGRPALTYIGSALIDIGAVEYIDKNGRASDPAPPYTNYHESITMSWRNGSWSVTSIAGQP